MNKENKLFVKVIFVLLALYMLSVTYYLSDLYNRVGDMEHAIMHAAKGTVCK